ncbi:serine protease [Sphingobium sp. H39-3-25]|uniref:S1 family peptidase n=1 Tax=Sphingobium arseniciresistens TaxID=3030834 RepID=UPI0023B8B6FF|nr:serine protease [Sphingobium arseniciresistens]
MPYKPNLGGSIPSSFPPQFPDAKISSISFSTVLIEQLSNDGEERPLAHATGFCWRHGPDVYVITARHVLCGRSPFDDTLMSANGFIPLLFDVFITVEHPQGSNMWTRGKVRLARSDEDDAPWLEDPDFAILRTDIAAWKLPLSPYASVRCLNDEPGNFTPMMTMVGFDCFVVGYTTPAKAGAMTPIWRRGALASEPLLAVDEKPMFLLDASTSPGLSGSPVFRRHTGPLPNEKDGEFHVKMDNVVATSFVGVYAGRLANSTVGGEVPFVFYGNRIPIILGSPHAPETAL